MKTSYQIFISGRWQYGLSDDQLEHSIAVEENSMQVIQYDMAHAIGVEVEQ